MDNARELRRLRAPAPAPQAIAHDGSRLWIGSRDTRRLYAIDTANWTARDEGVAPGIPWGMTFAGDDARVLLGEDPGDMRFVHRFVPGRGFRSEGRFAAPDGSGSHLSYDGDRLYISQWYAQQIVAVDEGGTPGSVVTVPHQIVGHTIVAGVFYCLTTDDEDTIDYWLTRVDARSGSAVSQDILRIPFHARGLAFDGKSFWTNHREADETVCFERPD